MVRWKGFTVEHDIWEKKEDLGNAREVLEELKNECEGEETREARYSKGEEF